MADTKVLERLSKLLELSARGEEHEAQVAGERAAELMAKHQIDMAMVAAHTMGASEIALEEGRVDDNESAPVSKRCELWHRILVVGVVEGLGGKCWRQSGGKSFMFYMVGPPDTVSAARYMYMALERDIGRLSRREMKTRAETNSWRRAYARGMALRVSERIRVGRATAMQSAGTALVHVSRQEQAVAESISKRNLKQSGGGDTKTPEAIEEGYRDGGSLDISDGNGRSRIGAGNKKLPGS